MGTYELPTGYEVVRVIDFNARKRLNWGLFGLSILVAAVISALGAILFPISTDAANTLFDNYVVFFILLGAFILTMMLIQTAFTKITGRQPHYGVFGLQTINVNDKNKYLTKRQYLTDVLLMQSLMALIILGVIFFAPIAWTFLLKMMLVITIASMVGGFYKMGILMRMPGDVRVLDTGERIEIYARMKNE